MSLPEQLAGVLADGVVLCHLANHVRPRAVASVHVPSPAQPALTMARRRRNVDNFLEACRKIGVEEVSFLKIFILFCTSLTTDKYLNFFITFLCRSSRIDIRQINTNIDKNIKSGKLFCMLRNIFYFVQGKNMYKEQFFYFYLILDFIK